MSADWLRLWHDMPTDPKWRVIAKASKQPLHLVIALWAVLLVDASKNAMSRGVTTCHDEDLSVTLDCDIDQITAIKEAMQGRVLDGNRLSGWEKRQPKKNDSGDPVTGAKSAAERKSKQRALENEMSDKGEFLSCHDMSRDVTIEKRREEKSKPKTLEPSALVVSTLPTCPHQEIISLYEKHLPMLPYPRVWEGNRQRNLAARWKWVLTAKKRDGASYATDHESALSFFDRYFDYVSKSDFLTGRNGRWSGCDLGWLVNAENFAKVVSGNYENKEAA